jgi:hypothetical protein
MTQVVASSTNNIVKVYSVGVQGATGAPGPSGSLQSSNSGSFSITGSLIVSGSNTFTNIGPAIFSGSVTSISGFTGSLVGIATTASYISPTFISASAAASGFGSGGSVPAGTISSSAQVVAALPAGTVSSSAQILPILTSSITNFNTEVSRSAAAAGFGASGTATWPVSGTPSGLLSSSAQVVAALPTGTVSSSAQILPILTSSITNFPTEVSRSAAAAGFGSGGGGSTFPFSGSAVITGSLVISGSTTMGTGDTRGLQIFNNGPANLSVRSNTGGTIIAFDGQTTQMYLSSNNSLGGTQISNMFFNTTFSGMGDGSGLGFINFAQGSGTSNDSFGSIRTYLKGVDKSEVRIYSQPVGVGVNPDISFISGSLIDVNRKIETDQDIEITDSSKGIILRSPNGTRYRITINDSGILVSGSI